MRDGFIRVGAGTPDVRVADVTYNGEQIRKQIELAYEKKVRILVFPELCVTSYTCGDLFLQERLLDAAKKEMVKIAQFTKDKEILISVGMPLTVNGKLYNCMVHAFDGKILGIVPKYNIPNYSEFYEARYFAQGFYKTEMISFEGSKVPFGMNLLIRCANVENLIVGTEICEDLWVPNPPSIAHAMAGATIIVNGSASVETTGKDTYRSSLVKGQSARLVCAYLYASTGEGESSTDVIFSGHNIIAENGRVLKESKRFHNELVYSEIDLERLTAERRRMTTYECKEREDYTIVEFSYKDEVANEAIELTRTYDKTPFVPNAKHDREERCQEILTLQALGLKKRLQHTGLKKVVLGISGGLDSTLALLVAVETFDMLGLSREGIIAVTMPCFGTTDRTYNNAVELTKRLGATLIEVPIQESVMLHMKDIGHDPEVHDVTYENSQARMRTLILMNLSNEYNALVVGTGDMSELALGWATYNGDHMSMYGVNCSVPKTLVRFLVEFFADTHEHEGVREVLLDILNTPVSPELLPPRDGVISQVTEDLVGPYELHDFFLYGMMRCVYTPIKIYRIACHTFAGEYDEETILKWLKTFYRRFFAQQFKRSCLPDGPKVGSVALSPRGDWRMPSDACATLWLAELENL